MNASDPPLACFPRDYFEARARFRALAGERGAELAHYPVDARGPCGDELTIDTAYLGAQAPQRLLVVLSGTHGVEGFAGSALQQHWLQTARPEDLPEDGGCLLIHAVNPYGFAWCRRVNEHNVDLNRNALAAFPGPPNRGYDALTAWLDPRTPPRGIDLFLVQGLLRLLRHGRDAMQQAIVSGQYRHPQGLFYGGERLEFSVRTVLDLLRAPRWHGARRVLVLDLHTGYGRYGSYTLMTDTDPASETYRDLVHWFGAERVATSRASGTVAYPVSGGLSERLAAELHAHAAVLEFGTYGPARVLAALRRENRAFHCEGAQSAARRRAAAELEELFCPRDPRWRMGVLAHGAAVLAQAARACFSRTPDAAGRARAREE
ncbi:MAG TPA: DUF2817 domain-containing protein [Burkholderiales bacterium]